MKLIYIKKDIDALGLRKGVFDAQTVTEKYPFVDFGNREYFDFFEASVFSLGTKVTDRKKGGKRYIVGVYKDGLFRTGVGNSYTPETFQVSYRIGPQMNSDNDSYVVKAGDLTVMEPYWFINSSGEISQGYQGEKSWADNWRKGMDNFFKTKDEAVKRHDELQKAMRLYKR